MQFLRQFLQFFYKNTITGKKLKGSDKKLFYQKGQHLNFLFKDFICYEEEIQGILKNYIKPGYLIFDIGGNIGQYALFFSDVNKPGKVLTIEPDPKTYSFLLFNIANNLIDNVEALNIGVGAAESKLTYYADSATGGRKGSFIKEAVGENYHGKTYEIDITTLDILINKYGIPDFIKIDVEGFETEVLKGLTAKLNNCHFFIEVRADSASEIFNYFSAETHICYCIDDKKEKQINQADEISDFANLLFVPVKMINTCRT
jgi:FkbM family methyltransferase